MPTAPEAKSGREALAMVDQEQESQEYGSDGGPEGDLVGLTSRLYFLPPEEGPDNLHVRPPFRW